MYNYIEYSEIYLETPESLWQYYRDEPAIDNNGGFIDFAPDNNNNGTSKVSK